MFQHGPKIMSYIVIDFFSLKISLFREEWESWKGDNWRNWEMRFKTHKSCRSRNQMSFGVSRDWEPWIVERPPSREASNEWRVERWDIRTLPSQTLVIYSGIHLRLDVTLFNFIKTLKNLNIHKLRELVWKQQMVFNSKCKNVSCCSAHFKVAQ